MCGEWEWSRVRVLVRVELLAEGPVGLFDLPLARVLFDSEQLGGIVSSGLGERRGENVCTL